MTMTMLLMMAAASFLPHSWEQTREEGWRLEWRDVSREVKKKGGEKEGRQRGRARRPSRDCLGLGRLAGPADASYNDYPARRARQALRSRARRGGEGGEGEVKREGGRREAGGKGGKDGRSRREGEREGERAQMRQGGRERVGTKGRMWRGRIWFRPARRPCRRIVQRLPCPPRSASAQVPGPAGHVVN